MAVRDHLRRADLLRAGDAAGARPRRPPWRYLGLRLPRRRDLLLRARHLLHRRRRGGCRSGPARDLAAPRLHLRDPPGALRALVAGLWPRRRIAPLAAQPAGLAGLRARLGRGRARLDARPRHSGRRRPRSLLGPGAAGRPGAPPRPAPVATQAAVRPHSLAGPGGGPGELVPDRLQRLPRPRPDLEPLPVRGRRLHPADPRQPAEGGAAEPQRADRRRRRHRLRDRPEPGHPQGRPRHPRSAVGADPGRHRGPGHRPADRAGRLPAQPRSGRHAVAGQCLRGRLPRSRRRIRLARLHRGGAARGARGGPQAGRHRSSPRRCRSRP